MQIDQLRVDVRPRPHFQGLDLGFAVLRAHAADTWRAWLALWLPAGLFALLLNWLVPGYGNLWPILLWWCRPLFERAPLYVLSRQVFGENVSWLDALRAWPRQLGGGWFRMLTWWRLLMPGRGLHQPVWQLEHARGATATARRRAIARDRTGAAAAWFGVACAHFEFVLEFGFMAFVALCVPGNTSMNPIWLLLPSSEISPLLQSSILIASYWLAAGIVGPIYVACCFTLYLNRRAALEAWDIELVLRQIRPPVHGTRGAVQPVLVAALCVLAAAALGGFPVPARADEALSCPKPDFVREREPNRRPPQDAAQARLRAELDQVYEHADLRRYECQEVWRLRDPGKTETKPKPKSRHSKTPRDLSQLASIMEAILVCAAIGAVAWLLYRYRDKWPSLKREPKVRAATEVGGLDIRPDSLPEDVPAAARALWAQGQRRGALALLYRATLSRLVSQDGLQVHSGATEGDCLQLVRQASHAERLNPDRLRIAVDGTNLWLSGAYADRWPAGPAFEDYCADWESEFGGSRAVLS
jgi:hypothetical protein